MKLAKLYVLSLSIAAVLAGPSAIAQTATTDPVGFSTVALPAGTSVVVPTLLKTSVFTGNAVISAAGVAPSVNPNWATNAYQPTQFTGGTPNYPTHYVEVVEGPYEGRSFDVLLNSTTALTVGAGEIPAALIGTTVKVVLRPHVTLDTLSTGSTGITAGDGISIYNSDGSTTVRYFDGTSWVDENFTNAAGHTVVDPGIGVAVTSATSAQVVLLGGVKTTKTATPISATGINLVGPLNPASQTTLVSSNIATAMAPGDGFNNVSNDGLMSIVGTYYSDGTNVLDGNFNTLPPNAPDAIAVNRGVFVTSTINAYWVTNSPLAP